MIIFEEISAIAFQNGTKHLSTTSGREITVIPFQENIAISQNSVVPIGYLLNLKDNRHKNILHLQMALTSRVFGVSCTAGYQEVSKIMLGYHRTKKKQKKKQNFGPCPLNYQYYRYEYSQYFMLTSLRP